MYSIEVVELEKDIDGKVVFLSRCMEHGVITVGIVGIPRGTLMWSKYILMVEEVGMRWVEICGCYTSNIDNFR